VHHDCSVAGSPFQLCGPSPNGRVHNSLEIITRERISEDNLSEPRPIKLPVSYYLRTKAADDRGERWSARLDNLASE